MKINWSKKSIFATENLEYDKEYLKAEETFQNDKLKLNGFLFVNDVLQSLGIPMVKRGQFDGWIWDEIDPNGQVAIKFKMKVENGDLILVLNEEKNIVDNVFKED